MRVDCRLTSKVLDCLTPLIQPDVTTLEIDASRPRRVARITRRIRIQLEPKATLNKPSKISAQTWMTQFFGLLCLSRGPFGQFAGR
jgi:methionine aminopeptidase